MGTEAPSSVGAFRSANGVDVPRGSWKRDEEISCAGGSSGV